MKPADAEAWICRHVDPTGEITLGRERPYLEPWGPELTEAFALARIAGQGPDAIVNVQVDVKLSGPAAIFWLAGTGCEKVSVTFAGPVPLAAAAL